MKKYVLITFIFALFSSSSFAFGSIEAVFDDLSDAIEQIKSDNDEICHERKMYALIDLGNAVSEYADGNSNATDLRISMGLLNTRIVAEDIFCLFPDMRNPNRNKELRHQESYRKARVEVKHGLKSGKSRFWFHGLLMKYGITSLFKALFP